MSLVFAIAKREETHAHQACMPFTSRAVSSCHLVQKPSPHLLFSGCCDPVLIKMASGTMQLSEGCCASAL